MEKQNKVLNGIKENNIGNSCCLGKKENDECYTSMQDILNELSYWANLKKFEGKRIVCPCDWDVTDDKDIYGIEVNYKEDPAEINAFKAVKSVKITKVIENAGTLFEAELEVETEVIETKLVEYELKEDEIEDFLKNKLTCNFVRTLTQNARRWGIKSITASGYNPATDSGIKFQDVDYSKYDICITNPPFSLYKEFLNKIIGNIDFICLAPAMNRVAPSFGVPLMLKQYYLGVGRQLALYFNNPTKELNYNSKRVNCDWITSFNDAQVDVNNKHFKSGIAYDLYKDDFAVVDGMTMSDGTHPLKINKRRIYPDDYNGWMFVCTSILDFLDQSEYEWYGTAFNKYYSSHPNMRPFTADSKLTQNGKNLFNGIVFRKKPKEESKNGVND